MLGDVLLDTHPSDSTEPPINDDTRVDGVAPATVVTTRASGSIRVAGVSGPLTSSSAPHIAHAAKRTCRTSLRRQYGQRLGTPKDSPKDGSWHP